MGAVRSRRYFYYFNVLLFAVMVTGAVGVWWLFWRALPTLDGTVSGPVSAAGKIVRDTAGIPEIQAGSIEDAMFLQGFATAQDRLFQMELLRRYAGGELAELFGPERLELDQRQRRMGFGRIAEAIVRNLTAEDRRYFAAYARGVNFYMDRHRGSLAVEFTLATGVSTQMGFDPKPWRIEDSILVGLVMFNDLTETSKDEILMTRMLEQGNRAKVEQLWQPLAGRDVMPGSNAWVVAGAKTVSGKPLLANDTHLRVGLPSTWHMVSLQAPGMSVKGFILPGLPGVIIGHNDRIAWGITNLGFDVEDVYAERVDQKQGLVMYQGQAAPLRIDTEVIRVRGGQPQVLKVAWTPHGPMAVPGLNVSIRWTLQDAGHFAYPFFHLAQAGNWREFREALRNFEGPGQNFVYADVDGNIGYQATGLLPIRKGFCGDRLLDGSSGQFEWQGYIPFDELPSVYNPESGIIATANQNPFPKNYPYAVCGRFAAPYRAEEIRAKLGAGRKFTATDMTAVQKDVYSGFALSIAQRAVAAYRKSKDHTEMADRAAEIAAGWNGQMESNLGTPLVVVEFANEIQKRVAEKAAPGLGEEYGWAMGTAVIDELWREKSPAWFRDWDEMAADCFRTAVSKIAKQQGPSPSNWNFGVQQTIEADNLVLGRIPVIGSWFNIGAAPWSGWTHTIKQAHDNFGPSMRFVGDLSDWEQSLGNLTIGESGLPLSGHYRDQWSNFYNGRPVAMPYKKIDGIHTLNVVPGKP